MKNQKPLIRYRIPQREFEKQAGLSTVTLWRRSKEDHNFPTPVFIGGKKLFYQDEVNIWIEANESETPPRSNLDVNTRVEA